MRSALGYSGVFGPSVFLDSASLRAGSARREINGLPGPEEGTPSGGG
jgi:hypothetical protein